MQIIVEILQLFFRFCLFLYRKAGINIVLFLALLLEISLMYSYYDTMQDEYRYEQKYTVSEKVEIRKLSPKKDSLELAGISLKKDENYYLVEIQVDNQYSHEIYYISLSAENQDGTYIPCSKIDYYDAVDGMVRTTIPAGAAGKMSYVLSMTKEREEQTEKIILDGWDADEKFHIATVDFHSGK